MNIQAHRRWWMVAAGVLAVLLAQPLRAQIDRRVSPEFELMRSATRTGVDFYKPGAWATVNVTVINRSQVEREGMAATYFALGPDVQYRTAIWVPPMSVRIQPQPVRFPEATITNPNLAGGVTTFLFRHPSGRDEMLSRQEGLLVVDVRSPTSGMLSGGEHSDEAKTLVVAARTVAGWPRTVYTVRPTEAPVLPEAYQGLDTLFLAAEAPSMTPAQLDAIRQWVLGGGRLWVMADLVSPQFLRQVLRGEWNVQEVGRTPLSTVAFDGQEGDARDYEEPVDLLRVVAPDMQVLYSIGGWPAAMTKTVGRGTLLVTTLGSRGWMEGDQPSADLARLSELFVRPATRPPAEPTRFAEYLGAQIGYQVMGPQPVLWTMVGLCALMAVAGLGLWRAQRLEWFAPVAVVLAVAVSGIFYTMGKAKRQEVPRVLASAHLAQVAPMQREAAAVGLLSIYTPDDLGEVGIEGHRGVSWVRPEGLSAGQSLRMVWTDMDRWRWEGVPLPSGAIRSLEFYRTDVYERAPQATLTFDSRGVRGVLERGPLGGIEDLILASPSGHMGVSLQQDDLFSATEADVLPAAQYVRGDLTAQARLRRQDVYRQVVGPASFPARPALLLWATPPDGGLRLGVEAERRQTALVEVPVRIQRPAPGETVTIPSVFVPYYDATSSVSERLGAPPPRSVLDKWSDMYNEGTARLRFELPAELLPLRATAGRLRLDVRAPGRRVQVFGGPAVAAGQAAAAARGEPFATFSPLGGEQTFSLPAPVLANLSQNGEVMIQIHVGPSSGLGEDPRWVLRDVRLEVETTIEAPNR